MLPMSQYLTEASAKSGYNDEHAVANVWNHVVNHPKVKALLSHPDSTKIKDELNKAMSDKTHPLHPDNVGLEGFKGGKKDKASIEGYKNELHKAAETVHAMANHKSFAGAVAKKLTAKVQGASKAKLSDTWEKHGNSSKSATATSKADIHIGEEKDGKDFHPVSLKKGDSQLFSGQPSEVKALYDHATSMHMKSSAAGKGPKFTAADKQSVMNSIHKVAKHLQDMKTYAHDREKQIKLRNTAQKIIDGIHATHPGLLSHVHFESATGNGKFAGSGKARHLVTTYTHTAGAHVHDTVTGREPILASVPRISLPKASSDPKKPRRPGALRIDYKVVKESKTKSKK